MITETVFKGLNALQLENDKLRVIVVPMPGGKIASLIKKDKNFEIFFQAKTDEFMKPSLYSGFAEFDASGFDDCFPSVDSCSVKIENRLVEYPDHGEIWSKAMTCSIDDGTVSLRCDSEILLYSYEKKIYLTGETLNIDYTIINTGNESFPCIWTMHGLINCEEDMEILLPAGTETVTIVQDSKILGTPGTVHRYPDAVLDDGNIYHLNRVNRRDADKTEKFYINGNIHKGICGVYYPSRDVTYKIIFDNGKLPYLGVWITEGGFRGDYNMALEPSNGFYDSIDIARNNDKLQTLMPGQKLVFGIKIEISDGRNPATIN